MFVAALTLRTGERDNGFHRELHDFGEQIERLLMMILLVCFGSVVAEGSLLAAADWRIVTVAVLTIGVVQPVCAWMSLMGSAMPKTERIIVSVFGIRGIGSIYYLAYASGQAHFDRDHVVWATVLLIVLISIAIHGVAVTPVMRWIDRARNIDNTIRTAPKT